MENTNQTPTPEITKITLQKLIKDTEWQINYYDGQVQQYQQNLTEKKILLQIYTNQLTQLN